MKKEKAMLLATESYKQALLDVQKAMDEYFETAFRICDKNIKDLTVKVEESQTHVCEHSGVEFKTREQ